MLAPLHCRFPQILLRNDSLLWTDFAKIVWMALLLASGRFNNTEAVPLLISSWRSGGRENEKDRREKMNGDGMARPSAALSLFVLCLGSLLSSSKLHWPLDDNSEW